MKNLYLLILSLSFLGLGTSHGYAKTNNYLSNDDLTPRSVIDTFAVLDPVLATFFSTESEPSNTQTIKIQSQNGVPTLTVKAPKGFEVAPVLSGDLVFAELVTAQASSFAVRLKPGNAEPISGNITLTNAAGFTQTIPVNGCSIFMISTINPVAWSHLGGTVSYRAYLGRLIQEGTYTVSPGQNALPGYVINTGNLNEQPLVDIVIPKGSPLGKFDFDIKIRDKNGIDLPVVHTVITVKGLKDIIPPASMTVVEGKICEPQAFSFDTSLTGMLAVSVKSGPFEITDKDVNDSSPITWANLLVISSSHLHVRIKQGTPAGSYTGVLEVQHVPNVSPLEVIGGILANIDIPASTVTKAETFAVLDSVLTGFTTQSGIASNSQNIQIDPRNGVPTLTVKAPAGFEIAAPLTPNLTYTDSVTVQSPTFAVRLKASNAAGPYAGNVILTNSDGFSRTVAVSGNVSAAETFAVLDSVLTGFTTQSGIASNSQNIQIDPRNGVPTLTVKAPAGFEIAAPLTPNPTYTDSVTVQSPTFAVRLKASNAAGPYAGNVILTNSSGFSRTVAVSGTVSEENPIYLSNIDTLKTTVGATSSDQYLVWLSTPGLPAKITAPEGFEIAYISGGRYSGGRSEFSSEITFNPRPSPPTDSYSYLLTDRFILRAQASSTPGIVSGNIKVESSGFTKYFPVNALVTTQSQFVSIDQISLTNPSFVVGKRGGSFILKAIFSPSFGGTYTISAGANGIPGYKPFTGQITTQIYDAPGQYQFEVPIPAGTPAGEFDFDVKFQNAYQTDIPVQHFKVTVFGVTSYTPPEPMTAIQGQPSEHKTFTVNALSRGILTAGVIDGPFEVAMWSDDPWWVAGDQLTNTPMYIRLKAGTPAGTYTGSLLINTANSGGVGILDTLKIPASTVLATAPLTFSKLDTLKTTTDTPSAVSYITFTRNQVNDTRPINIVAPTGFEVAYLFTEQYGSGGFANSLKFPADSSGLGVLPDKFAIRLKASDTSGVVSGNLRAEIGEIVQYINCNGVINEKPPLAFLRPAKTTAAVSAANGGTVSFQASFSVPLDNGTYTITTGEKALPGYTSQTNELVPIPGMPGYYKVEINIPAGVVPDYYDFQIKFQNDQVKNIPVQSAGITAYGVNNIVPPLEMTTVEGKASTPQPFEFRAVTISITALSIVDGPFEFTDQLSDNPDETHWVSSSIVQGQTYIRIKAGTPAGTYTGTMEIQGVNTGNRDIDVGVVGTIKIPASTVTPAPPQTFAVLDSVLTGFITTSGKASITQNINIDPRNGVPTLTVKAPAGYEVASVLSPNPTFTDSVTAQSPTFAVRLKAGAGVGLVTGGVALENSIGFTQTVAVSGTVMPLIIVPAPTQASRLLTFTNTTATSTTLSWTNGNGTNRAVFVKLTNNGVAAAKDSVTYTAGNFSTGAQIGSTGWYCVYNGTGNSTSITGLSPLTTYRVTVVDYNGTPSAEKYAVSGLSPALVTTTADPASPPTQASYHLAFTDITSNAATITWTNGNGKARAVFIAQTNFGLTVPGANTTYTPSTQFGAGSQIASTGWYCIYNGTGNSVSITGLASSNTYRVVVVDYNGNAAAEKYLTSGLAPANLTTPADQTTAPTQAAYHLAFTGITSSAATVTWTNGNGKARAVFIANTNFGLTVPVANTTYTPNTQFGAGSQIASSGWYCVYNGTGNSVNITGLAGSNTYRVLVVDYNGNASAEKYLANGLAPANFTTLIDQAVAPTQAAYHLTFTDITDDGATVNWTNGSGASRAVFVANTTMGVATPVANNTYTPDANFGSGNQVGSTGWYCVYAGTGNSAHITGLASGATYRVTVVDYNGANGSQQYVNSGLAPANVTTTGLIPPTQASTVAFDTIAPTHVNIHWYPGNGSRRVVFVKQTNNGFAEAVSGTTYKGNSTFGTGDQIGNTGWFCVYSGNSYNVDITGLQPNTTYRITVVDYNGSDGSEQYKTTSLIPVSVTTTINSRNIGIAKNSLNIGGTDVPMVEAANILSPNGDGKNDTWIVKNIEAYPNSVVSVFSGDGRQIFKEKGYYNEWNGDGKLVKGTYYYTIDLGNSLVIRGYITVL